MDRALHYPEFEEQALHKFRERGALTQQNVADEIDICLSTLKERLQVARRRYIGKDNPTRAKNFGQELPDKTNPLAQHPELGRRGRPGLPEWLHELVVHPNYIVFYRVLAETRTVEILRVKHAAQQTP